MWPEEWSWAAESAGQQRVSRLDRHRRLGSERSESYPEQQPVQGPDQPARRAV
jgi:hypothetical protein